MKIVFGLHNLTKCSFLVGWQWDAYRIGQSRSCTAIIILYAVIPFVKLHTAFCLDFMEPKSLTEKKQRML